MKKFCCNFEKIKKYNNFDEIRGNVWKTIEKIFRKLKKNWLVLNIICLNFEKHLSFLRKFYINFGNLQDSYKMLYKSSITKKFDEI